MPTTANDPFSETAADLDKSDAQASQPGASGTEVPVTVHASRYSAASKGAAKLPPIHEETRTVIIFPQGAVVRLSAAVTPGELVVLTNKRTGSDVICRVTNVKTQPGIQNYVHLEFTQRALDFWQEPASSPRNAAPARTSARIDPAATATTADTVFVSTGPVQPIEQTEPVVKPSAFTVETRTASPSLPKVTSLADDVAADPKASPKPPATTRPSETHSSATPAVRPPVVRASRPQLQPFEASIPRKNTSKVVIFSVAAVVLLAFCGVAATILLRQEHGTTSILADSNSFRPATPDSARTSLATDTPPFNASPRTSEIDPRVAAPAKNPSADISTPQLAPVHEVAEPPKVVITEPSKADVASQPASHPAPRATLNVGKMVAPKINTAARVNAQEPPPVLTADANTLPNVLTENLNAPAHIAVVAPPVLAAPSPVKGGQLQQPKLLSSVPAVYPSLARSQRLQGNVTIDTLIDAKGNVASMKVLNGNALLQNAATEALRRWKYQPATLDGQAIPIHINVTISFKLN